MTSSSFADVLPPRLILQCQYHQGQSTDWMWQWPEAAENFCFSDVLNGLTDVDHDYLEQLAEICLQSEGAAYQRIWWISNYSRALMCVVNGIPLPYGQQMRLHEGDEVEVGVTGFVVLFSLPVLPPSNNEPTFGTSFHKPSFDQQEDVRDFDLTKLAQTQEEDGLLGSGLEMFSGWVDTSDSSTESVLVKAELNAIEQFSESESVPISVEENKESSRTQVAWEKDSDSEISEDELMVSLHRQYLAVLHNPEYVDDKHLWVRIDRGVKHDVIDPMQVLMSQAGSHSGVSDLLGRVQDIDEVMTKIDSLGETDILAPAPFPNVMQLFAPESMSRDESLSLLRPAQVPSLTLREHHVVSIDSGMNVAWRNKSSKPS